MCQHGGRATLSSNGKIRLGGQTAAAFTPVLSLAGCQLRTPDSVAALQPVSFTKKVRSNNQPLLLMSLGATATPSGSPTVPVASTGQNKVIAS
jgi:hypothetical protein